LNGLGDLVQHVLNEFELVDPNPEFGVGRITWQNANLYHINDNFVMPLTCKDQCSFVELVAESPQKPRWFTSHWWGTPFRETLKMLQLHAQTRCLSLESTYWVCTFANNQHCLKELRVQDLMLTPFVQAIMTHTCEGTVMLMNMSATPFSRTWCTLENFISTTVARESKGAHLLDIAAIVHEGSQTYYDPETKEAVPIPYSTVLLSDDANGNLLDVVEIPGARFPAQVAKAGVRTDITVASASNPEDKRNILRLVVGDCNLQAHPPSRHPRYDEVNFAIRRIFAPRALFHAAFDGCVDDVESLLSQGLTSLDWQNARGSSPILAASFKNHASIIDLLVSGRGNPNLPDQRGDTPIAVAAEHNHVDALNILLQSRADPNLANLDGVTPLKLALQCSSLEAVQLLLHVGVSVHDATM